ncbi:hypothetical protein DH2020_049784 [Rehmannia glutinosa]|uniref:Uncharacterized protein n=1 Tax=Rehmannia glutinosa TaxID=99300 RepID=A0ABR0U2H9_REHGL
MGKFIPCPLPCHSIKHLQDSNQSNQTLHSDSSSSSSNSSLTSQSSLPSVPSLTPHSQTLEPATAAAAAAHHLCLATLKGHTSYIFSLALAGKHLFSGASNGEIRVWDRNPHNFSSPQNYTVSEGYSAVKSIVVLNDDKLITAHHDHKIRVWKIDNSKIPQKYKLITTLPTVHDRCVKLFSAKNYVEIRRHKKCTWVHHVDTVSALALSNDGVFLYSVSWDRTLKVWRASDFKCVESIQNAHDDAINAVVLSGDGYVYTGSADKLIKVDYCLGEGGAAHMTVAGALRGHKKAILCLAVVSDLLCSGSADRTVRIWRERVWK